MQTFSTIFVLVCMAIMVMFGMQSSMKAREFRRLFKDENDRDLGGAAILYLDPKSLSPGCALLQKKVLRGYKNSVLVAMVVLFYFIILNGFRYFVGR